MYFGASATVVLAGEGEYQEKSLRPLRMQDFNSLTARERLVALDLATGAKNSEIAQKLGISVKTIDTHRGHLLKKLGVRNNVELCLLAVRSGEVTP
jgi:DNA-binding NarL/FixJ family response regulator